MHSLCWSRSQKWKVVTICWKQCESRSASPSQTLAGKILEYWRITCVSRVAGALWEKSFALQCRLRGRVASLQLYQSTWLKPGRGTRISDRLVFLSSPGTVKVTKQCLLPGCAPILEHQDHIPISAALQEVLRGACAEGPLVFRSVGTSLSYPIKCAHQETEKLFWPHSQVQTDLERLEVKLPRRSVSWALRQYGPDHLSRKDIIWSHIWILHLCGLVVDRRR